MSRRGFIRHARPMWLAAAAVALLSLGSFIGARTIARHDQRTAAERRATTDAARAEILLERAKGFLVGLGGLLGSERTASQQRFAFLSGATITSFDLVDAVWIERNAGHLVARYATTVPPGTDASHWTALADPIANQGTVFAANATGVGRLHGATGFWLLESARFAGRVGYLAVFVPRGWMTLSLDDPPTQATVDLGDQRLEGRLAGAAAASAAFQALGQSWRIRVTAPPPGRIDTALPWLALAWPWAAGLVALVVGSASVRRRRAEHEVERIFDLSLDLLGIATSEGVFTHVNPAFTRTLGYSAEELTSRPLLDFAHPDDRWRSHQALERLARGEELGRFENRYLRKDGSVCWLEWNVHPIPEANRLYAAARDITARRDAEEQVRQAQEVLRSSRDELRRLADEHAAVRRVATLVARGVSSEDVFAAVAHEVRELLGADGARLSRYGPDRTATVVAADGEQDLVASAAASIVVEGTTWGHIEVGWRHEREVSSSTAERMRQFTELVATAIANAHSRAELTASRARVVAAADAERRRIERDLHDGTQQRLLALALALRLAQAEVPEDAEHLNEQIGGVLEELGAAVANLQELSRGIHPAILSRGGLAPAMAALANRSRLPVELETDVSGRLDERIEVAAYYLVSEALTNAAKHASATRVEVRVGLRDSELEVVVSDDGVGGADSSGGTGLLGLLDRVHALGGVLEIDSPRGQGTTLRARLPLTAPTVVVADPAPGGPVRDPTAQLT